jgi:hypothetical protein
MSFKMTVQVETVDQYCNYMCRFLRHDKRPECALFGKRLSIVDGGYLLAQYLRCADCKKADKAAEKAPC